MGFSNGITEPVERDREVNSDDAYDLARQREVDALAWIEEHLEGLVPEKLILSLSSLFWIRRQIMLAEGIGALDKAVAFDKIKIEIDALHKACGELYKSNS